MTDQRRYSLPAAVDLEVAYGSTATGLVASCESVKRRASLNLPFHEKDDSSVADTRAASKAAASYWQFVWTNRRFQLYLLSYVANHFGEWLTYLASLSAIESIQFDSQNATTSGVAISKLIIIRLLPNVLLAPFGGVLADGRDRRHVMIALDLGGAVVAWLFILAVQLSSINLIYGATFLQECLSGLYEPSRSAIVPLVVTNPDDLQKATTISGVAWSVVAAFGSATGGFLVAAFGLRACYLIDSITYLWSAVLVLCMGGSYSVVSKEDPSSESSSPLAYIRGMLIDGARYLRSTIFGGLVLLKASGAVVFGGFDVLNVAFAERGSVEGRSFRLGLLFSAIGIGCWVGPIIFDQCIDMSRPKTLQISCIYALCLVAVGSFCMGVSDRFWMACLFTAFRAMGSSVLWIHSSLLLQKFSAPSMLGRVLSIDYSLALLSEAFSAYLAGRLRDDAGLSIEEVSFVLGSLAATTLAIWVIYHCQGKGAARLDVGDAAEKEEESSPSEMTTLIHSSQK